MSYLRPRLLLQGTRPAGRNREARLRVRRESTRPLAPRWGRARRQSHCGAGSHAGGSDHNSGASARFTVFNYFPHFPGAWKSVGPPFKK